MSKLIDVVYHFDAGRWKATGVSIQSLLVNRGSFHYHIYCIVPQSLFDNAEFQAEMTALVAKADPKSKINFVAFDYSKATIPLSPDMAFGGGICYWKQDLWAMLPHLDRVIALDDDTIILQPLDELATMDLGDNYLMAFNYGQAFKTPFGTEKYGKIINLNAGVLVFNLKQIRKDKIYKKFAEYFKDKNLSFEQGLMAVTFRGRMAMYDDKNTLYNYRTHADWSTGGRPIAIIHYTGKKPWSYPTRKARIWWKYAKMTPFYADFHRHFWHNYLLYLAVMLVPARKWRHALRVKYSKV